MAKGKVLVVVIVLLIVLVGFLQYNGQLSLDGLGSLSGNDVKDTDNDGVQDKFDACPTIPGSIYNNGCPEENESPPPTTNPSTTVAPTQTNPPVTQSPTDLSLGLKDYPMKWYDASSSGNTPNEIDSKDLLWHLDTNSFSTYGAPVVGYGRAYLYVIENETESYLYCLDETDGSIYWKAPIIFVAMMDSPVLYDGNVYIAEISVKGFDAISGEPVLDINERDQEYTKYLAVSDGMLFSGATGIFCLDLDSGVVKWNYEDPSSPYIGSNIVYADRRLFACTGKDAFCVDVNTGALVWSSEIPLSYYSMYNISYYQGKVIVSNFSGNLTCLNASTGDQVWQLNYNGPNPDYQYSPVSVANDRLYFVGTDDGLFCHDVNTGAMIWKEPFLKISTTTPLLGFDQIFTISTDGQMMSHKISNGDLQWELSVDPYSMFSIANDRIYLTYGEYVVCYG